MDRRGSKAPLLALAPAMNTDSSDFEPQSPAENALQHNLDDTLTLNQKKSWLSIGGTLRKGALSIKGAIDYVRGEPLKLQDEEGSDIMPTME